MLLIENKKGLKTYTIINKYLCECGLLNEKNVCNALMKYMKRKLIYARPVYYYISVYTYSCFLL